MAQQNRITLKTYFQTGDVPTQAQFIDLIDSQLNPTDDSANGVPFAPVGNIIATDVQAAITELDGDKEASSNKGIASGYASLDASVKLPKAQLTYHNHNSGFESTPVLVEGTAGDASK